MKTLLTALQTRRQVLELLDQLSAAEQTIIRQGNSPARLIDFEQQQLLAELARLSRDGRAKGGIGRAYKARADRGRGKTPAVGLATAAQLRWLSHLLVLLYCAEALA